jgi:hypothetical protein
LSLTKSFCESVLDQAKLRVSKITCPYNGCGTQFARKRPWKCPTCLHYHAKKKNIFSECESCGEPLQAINCPSCDRVIILTEKAGAWDFDKVFAYAPRKGYRPPPPDTNADPTVEILPPLREEASSVPPTEDTMREERGQVYEHYVPAKLPPRRRPSAEARAGDSDKVYTYPASASIRDQPSMTTVPSEPSSTPPAKKVEVSASGYAYIVTTRYWKNRNYLFQIGKSYASSVLPACAAAFILFAIYGESAVIFLSLLLIIPGVIWYWRISGRMPFFCSCPSCNGTIPDLVQWTCPSCKTYLQGGIFGNCPNCHHPAAAFACPFCSKPMLLNQIAWGWDKDLVDKHTARPVVPTPASQPPAAAQEPGDPVIEMLDEYIKSSLGRYEFMQKKREELRRKYGDAEFVQDLLDDLENKIQKHRETESRGQR